MGLKVADLGLVLDARGTGIRLAAPACYNPFIVTGAPADGLTLHVRDGPLYRTEGWQPIFYEEKTWQLWLDGARRYVFVVSRETPPRRQIAIDEAFGEGEVVGELGAGVSPEQGVYPLRDIDIVLYANWLAGYGDVILHAAGVAIDGRGYCFTGDSGAGKSTLAATLSSAPSVTVLGEDQVILRRLEGRFWIYGTPWHENPARCSPLGAPLEKLFFLQRGGDHGVQPLGPVEGVTRLLQTAFIPYYRRDAVSGILDNLSALATQVPFHALSFQLGADVMRLIREA
jgi:hypothetical protein